MKLFVRVAAAAAITLAFSLPAAADNLDPASARKLHDYVLSMDKLRAMQAAMDDYNKAAPTDPALKAWASDQSNSGARTIADSEARLKANPHVWAIFQRHGLTADDVCMMAFVLIDAGMAMNSPDMARSVADRVSPAQIAFVKQHQAEMAKMSWLSGK